MDDKNKKTIPSALQKELGGTGTYIFGGFLSGNDYNVDLTGPRRIDIYDQMRKGDATIRSTFFTIRSLICTGNWYLEAASDSAEDKKVKDFVHEQLFNNTHSWSSVLWEATLYLAYGNYLFEKIYERTPDGMIGLKKLAPRHPKTVLKWEIDGGDFGITQVLPTGGSPQIPGWKLLTFVNEQEGENYEGISLFRSAYKHWYFKEGYYKIDAIAQERQGLGIPFFEKPAGASDEDIQKMREIMQNLRSNEQQYMEYPTGWIVGFMDMMSKTTKDAEPMIEHHNREIMKNVLLQFLELGKSGSGGARSMSSGHEQLFYLAIDSIKTYMQALFQRDLIKQMVDLNFTVKEYPKLQVARAGVVDYGILSSALQQLTSSGLMTPNFETEQHLRSVLDMPEISEEEYKENEQKKEDAAKALLDANMQNNDQSNGGGGGKDKSKNNPGKNKNDAEEVSNADQGKKKVQAAEDILDSALEFKQSLQNVIANKSI